MPKSYAQLQQSLTFDEMMKTLGEQFRTIPDNRTGNAVQYQLPDVLKAAFAMFSLKHHSLLDFKTQSTAEENNLHNIYRIEGNIPSDNQMRGILDPVDTQLLRPLFRTCFSLLSETGAIGEYEYRDKHVIVAHHRIHPFIAVVFQIKCRNFSYLLTVRHEVAISTVILEFQEIT